MDRNLRKERQGVVSSNKMDKTITVSVKWKEKHPDKLMEPEDDEIYRKIFGERRLYKN